MPLREGVYLGIDVGSQSTRAIAVDHNGKLLGTEDRPIKIYQSGTDGLRFEQKSQEIWAAVVSSVNELITKLKIPKETILGIGFDATCSLVLVADPKEEDDNENDVIMWMDHRAGAQADTINATKHWALNSVGGQISLEMQPPKLLWLKMNEPDRYSKTSEFMDLTDFLTFKCTDCNSRSQCTVVCKWLFQSSYAEKYWPSDLYEAIGLDTLIDNEIEFNKLGDETQLPGTKIGNGLSDSAAGELNLLPGTPVAAGLIDAHAGVLSLLSAAKQARPSLKVSECLYMIAGTSVCHMVLRPEEEHDYETPVNKGVWGPYHAAILPKYWLTEAGQSSVGLCLDNLVQFLCNCSDKKCIESCQSKIINRLMAIDNQQVLIDLIKDVHVWPDYHGNRSPLGNPKLKAAIIGLSLEDLDKNNLESVDRIYLAHVYSMACMSKYIVDTLTASGHKLKVAALCGGLQHNAIYVQAHADVLGLEIIIPDCDQTVALGSAILASNAANGGWRTLEKNLEQGFVLKSKVVQPNADTKLKRALETKYEVFRKMGSLMQELY